jgi:ABC-2 type transport system permease protein
VNRSELREHEIESFHYLRRRLTSNQLRVLLNGSRLRLAMIGIFSLIFWGVLFGLFYEGFQFLNSFLNATEEVVEYVFGIFFLSLLIMLVVSTGIILYAGLFHSREIGYLLSTPAADDRVFAYKFLEALAFSSWGFLLLGSPLLVAFGLTAHAPWFYYFLFFLYLLSFVLLAGSLGAAGALCVANFAARRPRTILVILGGITLVAIVLLISGVMRTPGEAMTRDWLDGVLDRLTFSQHPLLPSRWLSHGLIAAARGESDPALYYLLVAFSQGALVYLAVSVMARDLLRRGYSRVQGARSTRRHKGLYAIDSAFHAVFRFIPHSIRLLILKDLRCFRRDPAQWSQFLIFFGLLGFYFLNIRRIGIGQGVTNPYWSNLVGFLNLAVTALILSTFTTRFIYPLLSLEGRNFWILGLLPLKRESILWGKFAFSAGISLVATELLVVLSDLMLGLEPLMIGLHVVLIAILCLGLSAISVGLGAYMPNLREEDPSKIAAGFGGTLNLLVSLVYIAILVTILALPCRTYFDSISTNEGGIFAVPYDVFVRWVTYALSLCMLLGALAVAIPMGMGIRAFRRLEL